MQRSERWRRLAASICLAVAVVAGVAYSSIRAPVSESVPAEVSHARTQSAQDTLNTLAVEGRAPKTGYSRELFGGGWAQAGNCDMRNRILQRDLRAAQLDPATGCKVLRGTLTDPYTGSTVAFVQGAATSRTVQIDHVVAIADAWQKGAQLLMAEERVALYNDPLNLLAVDGRANIQKSDGDAATWLPPHKPYRCRYVARQIAVKAKYRLWVTEAERTAMLRVLRTCPTQQLPIAPAP